VSIRTSTARQLRRVARKLDPPPPRRGNGRRPPAKKQVAAPVTDVFAPWRTASEPGSRTASMFFDSYPRFFETSETTATKGRLNLRYEAIFAENRDVFPGATVLDIGSHDGRWSLAALACGAKSVIGIEARPDLVEHSNTTLAQYGYGADRCRFIAGDVFEAFRQNDFDVDVVLCLGYLYHTLRFNELLHDIRATNPRHVIIDTASNLMTHDAPAVAVKREPAMRQSNAVADPYTYGDIVLVGQPNMLALDIMMRAYGFTIDSVSDWPGLLRDNPELVALGDVGDYEREIRTTVRCSDTAGADGQ
jgi:predicted nicotinamide N-methyase